MEYFSKFKKLSIDSIDLSKVNFCLSCSCDLTGLTLKNVIAFCLSILTPIFLNDEIKFISTS